MWGVREDEKYKYPYQTGQEIQILDATIYNDPESVLGGEIELKFEEGHICLLDYPGKVSHRNIRIRELK